MPTQIPEENRQGIALIRSLSASDTKRIVDLLEEAKPTVDPVKLYPILHSALPDLSEGDALRLLETLYSLYLYRAHSDAALESFVDEIVQAAMTGEKTEDIQNELDSLKAKLTCLLTVRPLSILSKAHGLRTDGERIFSDAQIISDIRPVWDEDASKPPEGIVVTNTLKLLYYSVNGLEEIYISIDKYDIETLISVLLRAQDKMHTIESLSGENWMRILDE